MRAIRQDYWDITTQNTSIVRLKSFNTNSWQIHSTHLLFALFCFFGNRWTFRHFIIIHWCKLSAFTWSEWSANLSAVHVKWRKKKVYGEKCTRQNKNICYSSDLFFSFFFFGIFFLLSFSLCVCVWDAEKHEKKPWSISCESCAK